MQKTQNKPYIENKINNIKKKEKNYKLHKKTQ